MTSVPAISVVTFLFQMRGDARSKEATTSSLNEEKRVRFNIMAGMTVLVGGLLGNFNVYLFV